MAVTTPNNRIFYACQMVGLAKMATLETTRRLSHTVAHGVQSVGITTNFNLEQAFGLGQIQIYENIEGLPDVEVTLEKVLDGYPLLYHLATPSPASVGLVGRGKDRTDMSLGIYSDAFDSVTDSGNRYIAAAQNGCPEIEVYCSGMYVGSVSYTIPVDGNCTESVTLTGNSKEWITTPTDMHITSTGQDFGVGSWSASSDPDEPKATTMFSGGIQRRENVRLNRSIFPSTIYGMNGSGVGNAWDFTGDGSPRVHMQNASISTDFSREDIMELGARNPYYRAPGFPIEVSCELEAIAISGDFVNALETGDPTFWDPSHDNYNLKASGDNTKEEIIFIKLQDGTVFDLGKKNRLSSVSYGGGDATGGNVSISYSYSNFNEMTVLHPQDPAFSTYSTDQKNWTKDAAPSY